MLQFWSLPLINQVVLLLMGAVIVAGLVIILARVITSMKIKKIGPQGVVLGEESAAPADQPGPHAMCPNVKDVILIFKNRDEYRDKMWYIKDRLMPREIMNTAEEAIEKIIAFQESLYLSLLKAKEITGKENLAYTDQFKYFRVITRAIQPYLLSEARRMMNENGFIKKEQDGTFEDYVYRKKEDFLTMATKKLDEFYLIETPSRIELYDFMMLKVREPHGIMDTIESTIRQFLVITKNWQKEIDAIQKKMDDEMESILG